MSAIATLKEATHAQWVADVLKTDAKLAAEVKSSSARAKKAAAAAERVMAAINHVEERKADE